MIGQGYYLGRPEPHGSLTELGSTWSQQAECGLRNVKSAIAQLQSNNPVTALSAISLRQLPERSRRHSRNQTHRTRGNTDNGEPLFPPIAPAQLSSIGGPGALSGALAQHAPDQAQLLAE